MKLNDLIIELKQFYADKGIDKVKNSPRFNALEKVIAFYKKIYKVIILKLMRHLRMTKIFLETHMVK